MTVLTSARRLDPPVASPPVEPPAAAPPVPGLTVRQGQALTLLTEGLNNPEIADRLGITERTAKAHVQDLCDRLKARNRTHAVALAYQRGLLESGGQR